MQLFAKYQRTENGVLVSEVFSKQSPKSPLQPGDIIVSPEEIEYLQTIFVEDVERLNSLEICDLSRWKSDFVSLA
ncbi:MAG: hypothetical protein MnENMB40S_14170 [Rhizobiaceae bacterium MnEN-MB40S]|nr:MAG: hypothetical protein MnENMB40S_14170 [Rhizobiaceae bacterium MnEN-MB40S]